MGTQRVYSGWGSASGPFPHPPPGMSGPSSPTLRPPPCPFLANPADPSASCTHSHLPGSRPILRSNYNDVGVSSFSLWPLPEPHSCPFCLERIFFFNFVLDQVAHAPYPHSGCLLLVEVNRRHFILLYIYFSYLLAPSPGAITMLGT